VKCKRTEALRVSDVDWLPNKTNHIRLPSNAKAFFLCFFQSHHAHQTLIDHMAPAIVASTPGRTKEEATSPQSHTPAAPPDGGYGWVCVFGQFFINGFTWGVVAASYTLGDPLPFCTLLIHANFRVTACIWHTTCHTTNFPGEHH
jgi:hypothetical protein